MASFTCANSQSEAICTPLLPVEARAFSLLKDKRVWVSTNKINKLYCADCHQSVVGFAFHLNQITYNNVKDMNGLSAFGILIHTPYAFGSPFAIKSAAV